MIFNYSFFYIVSLKNLRTLSRLPLTKTSDYFLSKQVFESERLVQLF